MMLSWWQALLLSLLVYYGLLVPARLYRKSVWDKQIAMEELAFEVLPPKVKDRFQRKEQGLRELGFLPDSLLLWDYGGTGGIYVWHFKHPEQGAVARLEAVVDEDQAAAPYCFEGFFARFESGRSIELLNNSYYSFWAREPGEVVYAFDANDDLDFLYALHQFACELHLQRFPADTLVQRAWTVEERYTASTTVYAAQVKAGILRYDPTTETYRLTIPGAYRAMLYGKWPFSELVKLEAREHVEALKQAYQRAKATK